MVASDFSKTATVIIGVIGTITSSFMYRMIMAEKPFAYRTIEWVQIGWPIYLAIAIFAPLKNNPQVYHYSLLLAAFYLFVVDVALAILRFQLLWTDFVQPFFSALPPLATPYTSWDAIALFLGLILATIATIALLASLMYVYRGNELSSIAGTATTESTARLESKKKRRYELVSYFTIVVAIAGLLLASFMLILVGTERDFTDRDLEWLNVGWPVFLLFSVNLWEDVQPWWYVITLFLLAMYLLIVDLVLVTIRSDIFWEDFLEPFVDGFPAINLPIKDWDIVAYVVEFMLVIASVVVFVATVNFLWTKSSIEAEKKEEEVRQRKES